MTDGRQRTPTHPNCVTPLPRLATPQYELEVYPYVH